MKLRQMLAAINEMVQDEELDLDEHVWVTLYTMDDKLAMVEADPVDRHLIITAGNHG